MTAFASTPLAGLFALAPAASKAAVDWQTWHWIAFATFVVVMLLVDLGLFHRQIRETSLKEAGFWTVVWCSLALGFNGLIWWYAGPETAITFTLGYLVEWSLSIDNVFVFAVIFAFFGVPRKYQYRVLFWGILGAIVMRLTFVLVGAALLEWLNWIVLVFGGILILTAIKLAFKGDADVEPDKNIVLRIARRILPVAKGDHGEKFFVREAGKLAVTPLFMVLLVVESTDVIFAVDSVPAILGFTQDRFIVFTSNVFAIMGLRALYFLLAGVMDLFRYLRFGLSAILAFIGIKMIAEYFVPHRPGEHLIPPWASLLVVLGLLGLSIGASVFAKWREDRRRLADPGSDEVT